MKKNPGYLFHNLRQLKKLVEETDAPPAGLLNKKV